MNQPEDFFDKHGTTKVFSKPKELVNGNDQNDGPQADGSRHADGTHNRHSRIIPIQSSSEFVRALSPPDYVIDGIFQRGFLYSLTGKTGAGKTAIMLRLLASIALGRAIAGHEVQQGRALMCVGENPDDVRARWIALSEQMGFDPDDIAVEFVPGVYPISDLADVLSGRPELTFIGVDTGAAYFPGEDENDNKAMGDYARSFRRLTNLPGRPCTIVNCHPTKNASNETLTPRGGGSFLAEMDGNATGEKTDAIVELHWQGKFRGPDFQPVSFEIVTVTSPKLVTARGREMPTVIVRPLSDADAASKGEKAAQDLRKLLTVMLANPSASIADLAKAAGWSTRGEPHKSKVSRHMNDLKKQGLTAKELDTWTLTDKGKRMAKKAVKEAK